MEEGAFIEKRPKKAQKCPFFTHYIDLAKMNKGENLLGWVYYGKIIVVSSTSSDTPEYPELFPELTSTRSATLEGMVL